LTVRTREQLATLFDPRAESCSFALRQDEQAPSYWQRIPVIVNSELLVQPDEPDVDWNADYFEYRLLNPERYRVPSYECRTFHIGGRVTADRAWQFGEPSLPVLDYFGTGTAIMSSVMLLPSLPTPPTIALDAAGGRCGS